MSTETVEAWENEVKELLRETPKAVRICEGGGPENLRASLAVNYNKLLTSVAILEHECSTETIALGHGCRCCCACYDALLDRAMKADSRIVDLEKAYAAIERERDQLRSRVQAEPRAPEPPKPVDLAELLPVLKLSQQLAVLAHYATFCCAFCQGKIATAGIKEHIQTCEKHPLAAALKRIVDLEKAFDAVSENSAEAGEVFNLLYSRGLVPNEKPGPRLAQILARYLERLETARAALNETPD